MEYLDKQIKRLKIGATTSEFYKYYIVDSLRGAIVLSLANQFEDPINPNILDNDDVLIETIKIIGIMEISKDEKELVRLMNKRDTIKLKPTKEKTDFDKILTGIMKVPAKGKATK